MSVTGSNQRLEIEDGLQVLEVALSIEGDGDAGRTNEAVTAREAREVWGIGFGDPMTGDQASNEGEVELNITRDESSIDRPEVSTQITAGGSGHSFNETVYEYGFFWNTSDTPANRDHVFVQTHEDFFPVPIIWQEDETWHFTGFLRSVAGAGNYMEQEIRVYFTQADREVVPLQSRVID